MDWNAAIDKNREALKRILATLVGMAEMGAGGQFTFFRQKGGISPDIARAEKSKLSPAFTLPRHLHRAALSLLRPAEAAARRLVIAASRGLVVALPPVCPREPTPKTVATELLLRGLGIAVPMSHADLARDAAAKRAAAIPAARPRSLSLPLLDPLRTPFRVPRSLTPAHAAPRIPVLGFGTPFRPLPPSPDDPIDAARLALRLAALASALDDLPGQAKRFARWKARSDAALAQRTQADAAFEQDKQAGGTGVQGRGRHAAGAQGRKSGKAVRFRRLRSPKTGRPAGSRRKPTHEEREVLDVAHGQVFLALESPDTS